jgi:putative FmdB family regulatory protein
MPTYEYECNDCGHCFEAFQNMKDEPLKKCTECEGEVYRKISSNAGLIFKGNGFYLTDYGKGDKGKSSKKETMPPCGNKDACSSCKVDNKE